MAGEGVDFSPVGPGEGGENLLISEVRKTFFAAIDLKGGDDIGDVG